MPARDIVVELSGKCEMRMASEAGEARCHIRIIGIEFPMEKAKNLSTSLYSIIDEFLAISEHGVYMAIVTNRHTMSRLNPAYRAKSKTAVVV